MAENESNALEVVPHADLDRYLGKWYEIAHLPTRFQEGCSETTATYTLAENGSITVLNECTRNGKVKQAKGKAKVVDKSTGAKLKVTFFRPFYGDYWIIKLGDNYDYSVVGTRALSEDCYRVELCKSKSLHLENWELSKIVYLQKSNN